MDIYRCYFLDAQDHIRAVENIEAPALAHAKEQGFAILQGHPLWQSIEIWQGASKLYPVAKEERRAA